MTKTPQFVNLVSEENLQKLFSLLTNQTLNLKM